MANRDHYDTLGTTPSASADDIRKAYRSKALLLHPDKNADSDSTEQFKELTKAYEVLGDEQRRRDYDAGLRKRHLSGDNSHRTRKRTTTTTTTTTTTYPNAEAAFLQMWDFFRGSKPELMKKGPNMEYLLKCTLEELFHGKTSRLILTRKMPCGACGSSGLDPSVVDLQQARCMNCGGAGCVNCSQKGVDAGVYNSLLARAINHYLGDMTKIECGVCSGRKYLETKKILNVNIPPGSKDNDSMVFKNEADLFIDQGPIFQNNTVIPGDIMIRVEEVKHPVFERKNDDLEMVQKIDLKSALFGGVFELEYLDRNKVTCKLNGNEVVKPGMVKMLKGWGMPRSDGERGDLYIKFDIIFPEKKDLGDLEKLRGSKRAKKAAEKANGDTTSESSESSETSETKSDVYVELVDV